MSGNGTRIRRWVHAALVWALVGCGTEYAVGSNPNIPAPGDVAPGPTGDSADPGPEDPWADIDPGNLPDIHFVVAWHDAEYIESPYAAPGTLTRWSPARYAIIDLHGQVLASLDAPDAPGAPYWTSTYDRRMLHPAGAGQFLGVTHGVYTEDGPNLDVPWQFTHAIVWRGDAVSLNTELLARVGYSEGWAAHLEGWDRVLPVGEYAGWALQPSAPEALWLFDGGRYLSLPDMGLEVLSIADADAPISRWPVDQLLPGGVLDEDPSLARFWVRPGTDVDGTESLLLVVLLVDNSNPASLQLTWWAASWTEVTGIRWSAVLEDFDGWDVRYSGLDGGVTLHLTEAPLRWRVLRGGVPTEGAIDPVVCPHPRPGPLLDPIGPTFALLCRTADGTADQLAILHGGQEVWRIDGLTFGLQERTVPIADLIVLPQAE